MTTPYQMLREFHTKMNLACHDTPRLMTRKEWMLYYGNFDSERREFDAEFMLIGSHTLSTERNAKHASEALAKMLKEACDVVYTTIAPFVVMGVDFDEAFRRVHESNMAKDPSLRDANGKILKPPGWVKPDLSDLVKLEAKKEAW